MKNFGLKLADQIFESRPRKAFVHGDDAEEFTQHFDETLVEMAKRTDKQWWVLTDKDMAEIASGCVNTGIGISIGAALLGGLGIATVKLIRKRRNKKKK